MALHSLFILLSCVVVLASELYNDHDLLTCVSIYGSNASGCSTNGRCCSSINKLVVDLKNSCQIVSDFSQIIVQIQSDLDLVNTVNFENFCGSSGLTICGNNTVINCSHKFNERNKMDDGPGLFFRAVKNLSILDLTFSNCGSLQSSTSQNVSNMDNLTTYLFPTTLYLLNCSHVNLINIAICDGHGTGAALFDTVGDVKLINCSFNNNRPPPPDYPGGGGLHIEFTNCTPGHLGNCHHDKFSASYNIKRCSFVNNNATHLSISKTSYIRSTSYFQGMGKGGGMAIYINGKHRHCSIKVCDCIFANNSAVFGGGLFVQYNDSPSSNTVLFENSNFVENKCYIYGGGGVSGGFRVSPANSVVTINNTISFKNCVFERNSARGNGGGLSLFSTKGKNSNFETNNIYLVNCTWRNNSAFVASAVDLAPAVFNRLGSGLMPIPIVDNCSFDSNYNINITESKSDVHFNASVSGIATVYISGFQVEFRRDMFFVHNKGTALHLSLASVSVTNGSCLYFEGNTGKHGGAITMAAFSVLLIHDNSALWFVNNTSLSRGGAFFVHSIDHQHETYFAHSCFIHYDGHEPNVSTRNVTFYFQNNIAKSGVGHTLFATSLLPCTHHDPFKELGNVHYINTVHNVASLASKFAISSTGLDQMQELIPGTEIIMNISAFDELNKKRDAVYEASIVSPSNSNITIDSAYSQVSNNTVKFHGSSPGSTGLLALEAETASLTVSILSSECPPGFVNDGTSCKCLKLQGIAKCEGNYSFIVRGYWIGHCNDDMICTARCPFGYCGYHLTTSELVQLPSSFDDLDRTLCSEFRTGILCSECLNGTSVFYHSHYYHCGPNELCNLGVLFYLLSEILPLATFFLIITILNISLTSGAVHGFVLFAQIADSIDIRAHGTIHFPYKAKILSKLFELTYRMFNFNFFSLKHLSFCLWKSASALDLMAMKYVSVMFALFLVLLTVSVLNSWKCKMLCVCFRPRTLRATLTHSLTALLIICFSHCARACFLILSPTELTYPNHSETVVLYNGRLRPFHKGHVQYAIPALFFLIFLVFLPLVWLLLYPLLFKLLAMCHLSESRMSQLLSKFFPIELLDTFQSCFKDNCRHFAGLYFLYRLMPLITFIVKDGIIAYTLTSIQFLCMLAFHSAAQPYKNDSHNLIDTFIFANLLLINLLTAGSYGIIYSEDHFLIEIRYVIVYVQVVLMYLPLVYVLCYCVKKLYKAAKQHYLGYFQIGKDLEDSAFLPQLRNITDNDK